MIYEAIGGRLTANHPVAMVNVERRMCKCREKTSSNRIRGSYPPCVYKAFLGHEIIGLAIVERFWECELKEVQKRQPEWVMEAYMVG